MTVDLELGTWAEFDSDKVLKTPGRLSHSSLSEYAECGEKWRLTRGFRLAGNSTWWANIGGSATHTCTEVLDRIRLGEELEPPNWEETFEKYEAEERAKGRDIVASGRYLKDGLKWDGGPNKKDKGWWMHYGPLILEAYEKWRNEDQLDWWVMEIELRFEVVLGGELLIGAIDRVEYNKKTGELRIRDIKTGKDPTGFLQLGGYREGYRHTSGLEADSAEYVKFKADRAGEVFCYTTGYTDFTEVTPEWVDHQYAMARQGLEAGIFLSNSNNNCRYCPVNEFCRSYAGNQSLLVPVKSEQKSGKVKPDSVRPVL